MIAQMPDLVVTDRKRWPILAIEVQNLKEFDRGYAVNFRKEFVPELALASRVRCLIIASQDTAYVWAHNDRDPADAAPSFEFSTRPIVEHYLAQSKRHGAMARVDADSLRLYLRFWVEDLIRPVPADQRPFLPSELASLFEELKGGTVQEEPISS
jgi:hypothetical protein